MIRTINPIRVYRGVWHRADGVLVRLQAARQSRGPGAVTYASAEKLIRTISAPFVTELAGLRPIFDEQDRRFRSLGHSGWGTTSFEDSVLLYLLMRHFGCKTAFDVGTNVGITATMIGAAAAKNGGECITCDPIDYKSLTPGIRFIHGGSAKALAILQAEGKSIDFAFFDWVPDRRTRRLINTVFANDAILAAHDYKINTKGEQTIAALNVGYERIHEGQWYLPSSRPIEVADGVAVNLCTAFFIPKSRLRGLAT